MKPKKSSWKICLAGHVCKNAFNKLGNTKGRRGLYKTSPAISLNLWYFENNFTFFPNFNKSPTFWWYLPYYEKQKQKHPHIPFGVEVTSLQCESNPIYKSSPTGSPGFGDHISSSTIFSVLLPAKLSRPKYWLILLKKEEANFYE